MQITALSVYTLYALTSQFTHRTMLSVAIMLCVREIDCMQNNKSTTSGNSAVDMSTQWLRPWWACPPPGDAHVHPWWRPWWAVHPWRRPCFFSTYAFALLQFFGVICTSNHRFLVVYRHFKTYCTPIRLLTRALTTAVSHHFDDAHMTWFRWCRSLLLLAGDTPITDSLSKVLM